MYDQGALLFKFNNLFNKHFLSPFFFSVLSRKNWQGVGGLLFEAGVIDSYSTYHVIAISLQKG